MSGASLIEPFISLCHCPRGAQKTDDPSHKYLEIIADNLSKAGWSLGWVSAVDCQGREIWIVDAHRDDGRRFVVRADKKLTAFLELESAICACVEFT